MSHPHLPPAAPTLFHCKSSRGFRVLWTAEELAIPINLVLLPFPPRKRAQDFLDVNPLGTVPAFVEGDLTMTESCAIAHYLATRQGYTSLAIAPGDNDYGVFLDYLQHADATLTFPQTVYLRFTRFERELGLEAAGQAYGDWFGARLVKVDARLAEADFLCGGRFTVADIAIGYALLLATRIGLAEHLSPRLLGYLERLQERPAFIRAVGRENAASSEPGTARA